MRLFIWRDSNSVRQAINIIRFLTSAYRFSACVCVCVCEWTCVCVRVCGQWSGNMNQGSLKTHSCLFLFISVLICDTHEHWFFTCVWLFVNIGVYQTADAQVNLTHRRMTSFPSVRACLHACVFPLYICSIMHLCSSFFIFFIAWTYKTPINKSEKNSWYNSKKSKIAA